MRVPGETGFLKQEPMLQEVNRLRAELKSGSEQAKAG